MQKSLSVLAGALLSVSVFATGPALAQNSLIVERLINGSADILPLRGINPDTRAAKRYAIVIGNSDYADIPDLPNAHADAGAVATFLREQGYLVRYHEDITKRGFEDMLRRVLFDVDRDTEVVVFFAGHGFQIGAENYLVPTDADLDSVYDVPFEAVSLGSLVGIIGARARLQVVILDSCRDNPFAGKEVLTQVGNTLRETRTGFASQSAPLNSMLIYSTSPGALAYDGEGENSPFTASLIEEASASPESLIKDVFEKVRRSTFERTNGRQVPWDSSTLIEPASFGIGAQLSRPIEVSSTGTGETRGVARVTDLEVVAEETVVSLAPFSNVITADFVPEVDIGPALTAALNIGVTDTIRFTARPQTGVLMQRDRSGLNTDVTGRVLTGLDVDRLTLVNESVQVPAMTLTQGQLSDVIAIEVNGVAQQIALNLVPNACDMEAGDHLDPDGMGLTRFPNEIRPDIALAACRAAIEAEPDTGRFHYQLGRAQLALRNTDGAKASFERARDLGHTRAWHALGLLARYDESGVSGDNRIDSDAVRQLFARGVSEGDPYAMHTLGYELLTKGGTTEAEVEGYDLLVRAMEVGHTFAMNALTGIYLDESSNYYDPERALRYMNESVARGDIYGMLNLGIAYQQGQAGLTPDPAKAFQLIKDAHDAGHPSTSYTLAAMYNDGSAPGGRDRVLAVQTFEQGLERGDPISGATAAYTLMTESVSGYDQFDAAVMAAKGAALTNNVNAQYAQQQLDAMPQNVIDGGTQRLLVALGADLTVDGAFGPGSNAALNDVLGRLGMGPAEADPKARILQLAKAYWETSPFRVDLY